MVNDSEELLSRLNSAPNVQTVADAYGVSARTIRRWARALKLEAVRGTKWVKVEVQDNHNGAKARQS